MLSQVRTYEYEVSVTPQIKSDIAKILNNVEGCYDSYHTLQAENLWKDMRTVEELNSLVSSWILTLEKQVGFVKLIFLGEFSSCGFQSKLTNRLTSNAFTGLLQSAKCWCVRCHSSDGP